MENDIECPATFVPSFYKGEIKDFNDVYNSGKN
jgi:hypothetical protein